jgi:hypothetical protein
MPIMRRIANALLTTDTTPKMSMRRKISRANRSTEYMARMLTTRLVKKVQDFGAMALGLLPKILENDLVSVIFLFFFLFLSGSM